MDGYDFKQVNGVESVISSGIIENNIIDGRGEKLRKFGN